MTFVDELGLKPGQLALPGRCDARGGLFPITDEVGQEVAASLQQHIADWIKAAHPDVLPALAAGMNTLYEQGRAPFHFNDTAGVVEYARPAEQQPPTIDELGSYFCSLAKRLVSEAAAQGTPVTERFKYDISDRLTKGPLEDVCMLYQIRPRDYGPKRGC